MTVNRFKTDPRYLGPYEVVQKTYGGAYKLRELDGTELSRSVAAFHLLPYITRESSDMHKLVGDKEELDDSESEDSMMELSDEDDDDPDL